MLSTLYWLIVFPFIVAFILGFLTYGLNQADNATDAKKDCWLHRMIERHVFNKADNITGTTPPASVSSGKSGA